MSAPTRIGPLARHWREYRELALPPACPPNLLREARRAFYSAVSATMAELVVRKFSPDALQAMSDEIVEFLREVAEGRG